MDAPLKSLFVVSLPRSLSSLVYRVAARALGLAEPIWTMDGEILNVDRLAHYRGPRFDEGAKFTTRERDPVLFQKLTDFLGEVVVPRGYAYKDVVHPFVVAEWAGLQRFGVLAIQRDVCDVAYAMLERRWFYPKEAARRGTDPELAVIEGLLRAEAALATAPGAVIRYDDLIADEQALRGVLRSLYPTAELAPIRYIDEHFALQRDLQLRRRRSARYHEIQRKIEEVRRVLARLPASDAGLRDPPLRARC